MLNRNSLGNYLIKYCSSKHNPWSRAFKLCLYYPLQANKNYMFCLTNKPYYLVNLK